MSSGSDFLKKTSLVAIPLAGGLVVGYALGWWNVSRKSVAWDVWRRPEPTQGQIWVFDDSRIMQSARLGRHIGIPCEADQRVEILAVDDGWVSFRSLSSSPKGDGNSEPLDLFRLTHMPAPEAAKVAEAREAERMERLAKNSQNSEKLQAMMESQVKDSVAAQEKAALHAKALVPKSK